MLAYLDPSALRSLFFPDQDFTIIRARSQNLAIFWMCPGNLPYGAGMSAKRYEGNKKAATKYWPCQRLISWRALILYTLELENFDGSIWRTCCKTLPVEIELCVMLHVEWALRTNIKYKRRTIMSSWDVSIGKESETITMVNDRELQTFCWAKAELVAVSLLVCTVTHIVSSHA